MAEKITVFVVDDDASVRTSLARLLRSMGLSVKIFCSAQEFLDHPCPEAEFCMLVDVRMPGIDGLELQEKLNEKDTSYPIIFITAQSDKQVRLKAMKEGAVAFLLKPLDEQELIEAICKAIGINNTNQFYC